MLTSLQQLTTQYNVDSSLLSQITKICKPQQKSFISLIQWFGKEKMLPREFFIEKFNIAHRLIPYGKDCYGMFPLSGYTIYDSLGNLNTVYEGDRSLLGPPIGIIKFNKEEYERANNDYTKFWEWRNNRNATRLAMEETHQYDLKHAMHLVRLLRVGEEALTTGTINVYRSDAEELLSIRNGAWSYEQLVKYAEEKDEYIRKQLYVSTNLPKYPDIKLAASLILQIQDMVWTKNK